MKFRFLSKEKLHFIIDGERAIEPIVADMKELIKKFKVYKEKK